jgi:putative pyruvate formate lyase activating enzyme
MIYIDLYHSGELRQRIREAYHRLSACNLCPHDCGVNRLQGETGVCRSGVRPKIASSNVHRGEEPPVSGTRGSGTIFLGGCTLRCRFCQNFPISQLGNGDEISTFELSRRMLQLQKRGVHNINFVTPTHYLPQILAALYLAVPDGFTLPVVWNSSGYERIDVLQLLDGVVSIYLPDMKYHDDTVAREYSGATGYRDLNRLAVTEMLRQVGHLQLDDHGIAVRGLIIRHLVLPERKSGSQDILRWIADNLGRDTHIALMSQYFPAYQAADDPVIGRSLEPDEYDEVTETLETLGLDNGWVQELDARRGLV